MPTTTEPRTFPSPSAAGRPPRRRLAAVLAACAVAAALAGCAGPRIVEADVSSYGNWPESRAPASYAFERLPSQEAQPDRQAQLEDTAATALAEAGFRRTTDDARADVLVQVSSRTQRYDRGGYYGDPLLRGGLYYGSRWRGSGAGLGYGWGPIWYLTEVSMLIRDARTKQVLYETRAQHEGSWADDAVRAALFEAALKDFPRPAVSPRRVTVQIGPG